MAEDRPRSTRVAQAALVAALITLGWNLWRDKDAPWAEFVRSGVFVTTLCIAITLALVVIAVWSRVNQLYRDMFAARAKLKKELDAALAELRSAREQITAIANRDAGLWADHWAGLNAKIDTAKKELEEQHKRDMTVAIASIESSYQRLYAKPVEGGKK